MVVRLEERHREQTEDVGRLIINAGGQQPIPLYAIADLRMGEGPSEVRRVDGRRVALVQANIATGSLGGAVKAIESNLRKGMDWPADMNFYITGQNEEWERSKGSLYLALGLSLFLVYVIMAAQFESLLQPLIILLTVPLAFVGAILGLKALDISLSIVVFLGFIMLVGIVVNNAIVLIDYINTLKQRGAGRREAIVAACSVRLRPILMTTATTVLGLTPMAIGWGDGAEIRMPMAVAVMGGLVTSTLLTLLVVPTVYSLVDELKGKWIKPPSGDDDAVEEGREIELKPEFPSRV
jgi:hydrophobic/amphiphilic exporter-1 (mainly G- bacteria), HAE1 family